MTAPGLLWTEGDLMASVEMCRPFSMVSVESLIELGRQVEAMLLGGVPGDFVECGVWKGGASFLMADLLRKAGVTDRRVWMFDSFEGIPDPKELDGASALSWAKAPGNLERLRVSEEEVRNSAGALGLGQYVRPVKGWFDETLPSHKGDIARIALLRIDADWHASVSRCLETLYDKVAQDGLIVLDDYYTYDGCSIATHEFLSARRLPQKIEGPLDGARGMPAVIAKGAWPWTDMRRLVGTLRDITAALPAGEVCGLADQEEIRWLAPSHLRLRPFPEHDGFYGGPPAGDFAALEELDRLRRGGTGFLAISWPAFWWLDYYGEFHRRLREKATCVLENDRVVVFDLRGWQEGLA